MLRKSHNLPLGIALVVGIIFMTCLPSNGTAATTKWTGVTGSWHTSSSWSPAGIPNASTFDAYIDQGATGTSSVVSITSSSATVGNLYIDSGDRLNISNLRTLTVGTTGGGILDNSGSIYLNSTSSTTRLTIGSDVTLSGGGNVIMSPDTDGINSNQIYYSSNTYRLTNDDNTISGTGRIYSLLTNYGTVDANVSNQRLYLNTLTKINNGTMKASGGGILDVDIDVSGSGSWVADNGTIDLTLTGVMTPISVSGSSISVINNGALYLSNASTIGSSLSMQGSSLNMGATGNLTVNSNSTNVSSLTLSGDFSFAMTDESRMSWSSLDKLTMTGIGVGLEVGGRDNGAGFLFEDNTNFDMVALALGGSAYVTLRDQINNGNRGGTGGIYEALYLDALTLATGSILDLNGLNLYVNGVKLSTGVYGQGAITNSAVPVPSTLVLIGSGLAGLLCLRRRTISS